MNGLSSSLPLEGFLTGSGSGTSLVMVLFSDEYAQVHGVSVTVHVPALTAILLTICSDPSPVMIILKSLASFFLRWKIALSPF